jgi:hypothetical protein
MGESQTREDTPSPVQDNWGRHDPHSQEAIRKINSEILQLDNQRFLLTTTAVVFFATTAGWTTTLLRSGGPTLPAFAQSIPPAVTLLVWGVLSVLFHYQLALARTVRWLTAYQMLRGSAFEWTWHAFRRQDTERSPGNRQGKMPFAAYRVITTVFILLTVGAFFYFLLLQLIITPGLDLPRLPPWPPSMWFTWAILGFLMIALAGLAYWRTHMVAGPKATTQENIYLARWGEAARGGLEYQKMDQTLNDSDS